MADPVLLASFAHPQATYPGGNPIYNDYTDSYPAGTNRLVVIRAARSKFFTVWSGATATVNTGSGAVTAAYVSRTTSAYSTEEIAWALPIGTSGSAQSSTMRVDWGINTETIGAFTVEVWGNVDQTTPVASSVQNYATSTALTSSATVPAGKACSIGVTGNFTAEVAGTGVTVALSQITGASSGYAHAVAYRIGGAPSLTLTGATVHAGLSVVLNSDSPIVSDLQGSTTLADAVATGSLGQGVGTITTNTWKNAAGDVLPSQTIPLLTFLRMSDGLQVLTLTNQVTSASPTAPVLSIPNAALIPGVWYMVASWTADGQIAGIEPYQAI